MELSQKQRNMLNSYSYIKQELSQKQRNMLNSYFFYKV